MVLRSFGIPVIPRPIKLICKPRAKPGEEMHKMGVIDEIAQ